MLDIFAVSGLEWVYDKIEDRYGCAAAWLVTPGLAGIILAAIVAILTTIF